MAKSSALITQTPTIQTSSAETSSAKINRQDSSPQLHATAGRGITRSSWDGRPLPEHESFQLEWQIVILCRRIQGAIGGKARARRLLRNGCGGRSRLLLTCLGSCRLVLTCLGSCRLVLT